MNKKQRDFLKREVDRKARERCARGYMDCDPESLTVSAAEFEAEGYKEIADSLRRFRDMVVNPLLGEGWSLDQIERTALKHFKSQK